MNSGFFPVVSVIIPTFNEERRLPACLDRLKNQDYPYDRLELIVVDDGSTDATRAIAATYGAAVLESGERHIERSKNIGLAAATGEYVLFLDADVMLVESDWLSSAVMLLAQFPGALGVQGAHWLYAKSHTAPNRYSEILGVNDPVAYFLGKRGIFHPWEKTWTGKGEVIFDDTRATVVRFALNELPTLGSQGYLTRREPLLEHVLWQPYFFHLEAAQTLAARGLDQVVFLKRAVEHDYAQSWLHFFRKLYRNGWLFLKYRTMRQYSYGLGSWRFFAAVFAMVTLVIPIYQAVRGYWRQRDIVWLWHPVACLVTPVLYGMVIVHWYVRKIWNTVFRG